LRAFLIEVNKASAIYVDLGEVRISPIDEIINQTQASI
jgi:hypothetical protein